MFEDLMKRAKELGERVDTDWAEENSAQYDLFADRIQTEWMMGNITDKQFDELACTAFYDFIDLKCAEEE